MTMALSSLHLEAFVALAKSKSFSEAARRLHVTQSALSQRILNLEADLEVTLFIRESTGARLSETGAKLLKYCQAKNSLEDEFLAELKTTNSKELSGIFRIA